MAHEPLNSTAADRETRVLDAESTVDTSEKQRVRLAGPERQVQIASAALKLVARDGLQATTLARIAEEVGMETPSLYAHFSGRRDIFLAAVDLLFEKVATRFGKLTDENMLTRLRTSGQTHEQFVREEFDDFVVPVFAFITAPRDSGLSEAVGERNLHTLDMLASIVEKGQQQGTIRADMDPRVAAYELLILYWAADITKLMGIGEFVGDGIYDKILDLFLRDMAPSPETGTGQASNAG